MKDLKPEEPVELIEMKVPMGTYLSKLVLILESMDESAQESDEEAPPPPSFQYYSWDE